MPAAFRAFCARADAAADQDIDMRLLQERDERAVAFAVVLQHMRRFDGAILHAS